MIEQEGGPISYDTGSCDAGSCGPGDAGAGDEAGAARRARESGDREDAIALAEDEAGRDPGLGLLLELARRGEHDPWDLDIVALTDRYLEALDRRLDARDLGYVARLIFYAAALVHLKAQALAARQARLEAEARGPDPLDDLGALDLDGEGGGGPLSRLRPDDLPLLYPDFMQGGAGRGAPGLVPHDRRARERGLTLLDLIQALKSYDDRIAQREAELAAEEVYDEALLHQECVGTSHQDDLDRDIVEVRHDLWDRLGPDEPLELEALVTPRRSRAAAYLALLFLAHDEEVQLEQQELYGRLWIRRGAYFGEVRAGVRVDDEDEDEDGDGPAGEPEGARVAAAAAQDAETDEAADGGEREDEDD